MKKVIIAVGSHHSGKSVTINNCLKQLLKIKKTAYLFTRNGRNGKIMSQSFEEASYRKPENVISYLKYDILVLATRPENEKISYLKEIKKYCVDAGYKVSEVHIKRTGDPNTYAKEMLHYIDN